MPKNRPDQTYNPNTLRRKFVAEWRIDAFPSLSQALLEVTQIISHELSVPPLKFVGHPPRLIDLDEPSLAKWLSDFKPFLRAELSKAFCLSEHPRNPTLTLWLGPGNSLQIENLSFVDPEQFPLNSLLVTMGEVCTLLRAFYGYTSDTLLSKVHGRRMRAHEIGVSRLPPSERHHVPTPSMEGIIDDLPPLLVRSEFDYTCVPDGVWWINFWSAKQVETIGLGRIRSADWFQVIEQSGGTLVLVATEEPTDVRLPEHREKLGRIVEHLRLKELQERYRIGS